MEAVRQLGSRPTKNKEEQLMKFQVRIRDIMSDKPASKLFDTYAEAAEKLKEVQAEIKETWATPDISAAYIFENRI